MREAVRRRLDDELGDDALAARLSDSLDATLQERLANEDIATSPLLSYRPPTGRDDEIDSLWILAFGYRLRETGGSVDIGDDVPAMDAIEPGPVNEELARQAASFVERRSVPIIAQWEIARTLDRLKVPGVISVGPDEAADGSIVYLSTAGVIEKGLRLAAEARVPVGRPGLLAHADHAVRCLLTAAASGLRVVVPAGVRLPAGYDAESGQRWTRSRSDFIPVDLMARAHL